MLPWTMLLSRPVGGMLGGRAAVAGGFRSFRNSLRKWVVVFFQAEVGIRDYKVTGVQTCALPISRSSGNAPPTKRVKPFTRPTPSPSWLIPIISASYSSFFRTGRSASHALTLLAVLVPVRSEERRVG